MHKLKRDSAASLDATLAMRAQPSVKKDLELASLVNLLAVLHVHRCTASRIKGFNGSLGSQSRMHTYGVWLLKKHQSCQVQRCATCYTQHTTRYTLHAV